MTVLCVIHRCTPYDVLHHTSKSVGAMTAYNTSTVAHTILQIHRVSTILSIL
jgi:hypothetical protein